MKFRQSHFGDWVDIEPPPGCDAVIICADTVQHQPVAICLPHQVYKDKLLQIMDSNETNEVTVMPYRNADKVTIKRSDLERQTSEEG